jgi:ribonuclease BN (tRNA processing enzyme)
MVGRCHRRAFLLSAAGWAAASRVRGAEAPGTRLILLGTAGGPRPKAPASAPAQVIVSNGTAYVVDCGNGVARQLVLAGVKLPSVRHVFITHHHSDHNADVGTLLLVAWGAGLKNRVDLWGGPPLEKMMRLFFEMNAYDIATRVADEGRVPLKPLVHAHDLSRAGLVLQDDHVKVTAALVSHPPVVPAFAFRFDARDRSIVISGDTSRSDALIALARGADVLVHETLYLPAVDRLVAGDSNATSLRAHLLASHTSAEDCGRVAQAAGVKTLVLSHFVPTDDPAVTDAMWLDAARAHFTGRVIVGKDLMEI